MSLNCGGDGGDGADAGAVSITNNSTISTGFGDLNGFGRDSAGIQAQSIGKGGGNGGFSISGAISMLNASGEGSAMACGGSGGGSGSGSDVTVNNNGADITTMGDRSAGIEAQSIGGGGGHGGFSFSSLEISDELTLTSGGSDGASGDGGNVNVTSASRIYTKGDDATGILAQSIGAGGGVTGVNINGDMSGGSSTSVLLGAAGTGSGKGYSASVVNNGLINTKGNRASGIIAQSIGGGGGIGWVGVTGSVQSNDASLTLGGRGSSGDGDSVSVMNNGNISVAGLGSCGILAQSIGGGGGLGSNDALASTSGITIGGSTSTSGDGRPVAVTNHNPITTSGDGSYGIIAQSIGGGGGFASESDAFVVSGIQTTMPEVDGSNTGDGDTVTIDNSGQISTSGSGACGIVAQSIGGGGGLNAASGAAGSAGGAGSGEALDLTNSGTVTTTGAYAHGIFAQSAGGSGHGFTVGVNNSGTITVSGTGAHAIYAESSGQSGESFILISNMPGGTLVGAPDGTAPIRLSGGIQNQILNSGTITSYGALIEGDESTFINSEMGTLNGRSFPGNLTNHGTINPGNSPGDLSVTGSYTQSHLGILVTELFSPDVYDRIVVDGTPGTAVLDGALAPVAYDGFKPRCNHVFSGIVTADGGISGTFSRIVDQQFTPTLSWETRYLPNSVDLFVKRSYANPELGLNDNQQAIAAVLDEWSWVANGDLDSVLNAIDYLPDSGSVRNAFKQISPEKAEGARHARPCRSRLSDAPPGPRDQGVAFRRPADRSAGQHAVAPCRDRPSVRRSDSGF